MKTLIVIPARLASTRLPNKMLLAETGHALIEHTYRAALRSRLADRVMVAADDQRIVDAVQAFGGEVCQTRVDHVSGTDRIAEVAAAHPEYDLLVNVQGDEPEIEGSTIDAAIEMLRSSPTAAMSTVAVPIRDAQLLTDPSCVKVVVDCNSNAIYFSRSQIPYPRNLENVSPETVYLQHVGLYVYRRDFLLKFSSLAGSKLEQVESLEQLRAIENGYKISVAIAEKAAKGIDTPEDYRAFVRRQMSC
jgi:3-deoxy-manno-octulosonate cytidylyltransferase (CMP-KDO synthetase)